MRGGEVPYLSRMKYPIGIQDFAKIRTEGYAYVDKTEQIYRLVTGGAYYFLSRPRRFGKSLLLSTMYELYRGNRELFTGLWIDERWDWEGQPPRAVIWLKFASSGFQTLGLEAAIDEMLNRTAQDYGVELPTGPYNKRFRRLIELLGRKHRAVLLIDEYDKPLIDYLDDLSRAEANRNILKTFYSVIKDSDPYLELVFMTGVSAFSKVTIFSDLNNLRNISLHSIGYTIAGLTEAELQTTFAQDLQTVDLAKMRAWYNGYSWGGEQTLYNPFSILNFLDGKQYKNYWFETGTPTFLVREMRKRGNYDITSIKTPSSTLTSFDIDQLDPVGVLFQTGYLTVTEYVEEDLLYTLAYPNLEVRHSLEQLLLQEYVDQPASEVLPRVVQLRNALRDADLQEVIHLLNASFAAIPYDHWAGQNEHFYHAIVHLTFSLLGTYVRSEVHTSRGRCDALAETTDYVYAFEFKLDRNAMDAVSQIIERGYLEPYAADSRTAIAVGINFVTRKRQIIDWHATYLHKGRFT